MILVNIESLSLSELRNIAEQEGISDSDVMDRDELVEALQEKCEEEDDAPIAIPILAIFQVLPISVAWETMLKDFQAS